MATLGKEEETPSVIPAAQKTSKDCPSDRDLEVTCMYKEDNLDQILVEEQEEAPDDFLDGNLEVKENFMLFNSTTERMEEFNMEKDEES